MGLDDLNADGNTGCKSFDLGSNQVKRPPRSVNEFHTILARWRLWRVTFAIVTLLV